MTCETCAFATERLVVAEWHSSASVPTGQDLARIVAGLLTEPVTRSLPPAWHGPYSRERATAWIGQRDAEGPTLLAVERSSGEPVGLLILLEEEAADGIEVRLGYVLVEWAWGRGFGSELIAGFVQWCRRHTGIRSLAGGVAVDNPASARILEKSGFVLVDGGGTPGGERLFVLSLQR